jgi:membrane fusion protein (multidrug efflux system)
MNTSHRRVSRAACLVLAGAFIAACGEAPQPQEPPPIPEVNVVTVRAQPMVLTTELAGRTNPYMVSEVRPQVGGIVKQRLFREGGDVRAGDPLYEIDAATYQASHNSAKAAVAKAEANLKVARLTAARYKELVKINAVSKQDNDAAAAALLQAQADVASAKAALDMAAINLGYTQVVAPISGRIGQSGITAGALVSASQPEPLATIQQLDPIYVDVAQSSVELLRLRRAVASGQIRTSNGDRAGVRLILEDGSVYGRAGELQFSDVTVDPGTGMVTLRAVFPNPDHALLPGMYVRAVLEEGRRDDAILLPQQAVTRNAKGQATALILNDEDKVEARVLEVSRTLGDRWLVEDGVRPGERVIVEGLQKVRPGAVARGVDVSRPRVANREGATAG